MKKLILFSLFCILMTSTIFSQNESGKITIQNRKYYQNGQALNAQQLKTLLTNNPASAPDYMKSKKHTNIAGPMIIGGSLCLVAGSAISLASSIKESNDLRNGTYSGNYPSGLGLILLGLVIDVAALPILLPAVKDFKKSIERYNSNVSKTSYRDVHFNMVVKSTGLGIRMSF